MTTDQPITIGRGEDVTLTGVITDEDDATVDISSDALKFTVKDNLGDADSAKIFQIAGTSLGADGTFSIVIADTHTKSIDLRTRWCDLKLTTAGGAMTKVAFGRFILTPDVNKA